MTYTDCWNPQNESEAREQILTGATPETFEKTGAHEAFEVLRLETPGKRPCAIDFGCGIGRVARYVAPYCDHLYCVDTSESMLEMARERCRELPNVTYVQSENVSLFELRSRIDLIYSILCLQHLRREDAHAALRGFARVLKPGGRLYFTVPRRHSPAYGAHDESSLRGTRLYDWTELMNLMGRDDWVRKGVDGLDGNFRVWAYRR